MPEDISLEGPQRRLNTATATAPEHKAAAPAPEPSAAEPGDNGQGWLLRILLGWHASFTLMGIVLELLLWTDGAPWFAHLVLYGLAASYVTLGAPALSGARPPRAGHLFLAIAYAGTLLLTTVDDRTPIALYLVLPTTFALLSPISLAVAACAGLTLLSDALYLGHHSFSAQAVGETALQNATTWLFAVLVGFFVTQLLTENRRRGDLIRLLEENRALLASAYHDAGVTRHHKLSLPTSARAACRKYTSGCGNGPASTNSPPPRSPSPSSTGGASPPTPATWCTAAAASSASAACTSPGHPARSRSGPSRSSTSRK